MFIASKDNKDDVVEYIKTVFADEDTVDVDVTPDGEWYSNQRDEECRQYKVDRKMRRHYDGKVITCTPVYVRVIIENTTEDLHHVGLVSIA